MTPPLICHFCDDPLDETEVGAVAGDVVACQDCLATGEVQS